MRILSPLALGLAAVSAGVSQTGPATDRVGFPENYQNWQLLYVFDRPDTRQVRTIYANPAAASITPNGQFNYPYGSVLVMETWNALRDAQGTPVLDANGRYQKDPAATPTIFVQKKDRGFGEAYGANRSGEWEFVAYRPDRTYQTTPPNSFGCAQCHQVMGQAQDYVARVGLYLNGGSGALPDGVMKHYRFLPGEIRVKNGGTVTFYNDDPVEHTIGDAFPNGFVSPRLKPGQSFTVRFSVPGELNFQCTIHPSMRGKVIVEP
ncbi:MAG: hypothetical protein FJW40_04015 [Acidobacteria bacterium]|nr:hypothetical protein [Acidobacteriota bacterium]